MNFLALVQSLQLNCGVSGTITTTAGQSGSIGRLVAWIGDAWRELQSEHDDWEWMRSSNLLGGGASFVPAAGQASTPLGTGANQVGVAWDDFGKWDEDTFRCYSTASGTANETFLDPIPFDTWRNSYMLGAMRQVQTRPVVCAVGPDQSLNLGPPPNGQYTITADYFRAATELVNDTDVPQWLPVRFHMLIVYDAMLKYAGYEAAAEVYERATAERGRMFPRLQALRAPRVSFAGALA